MQVLFDGSILGFNLVQVLVQNLLQQNLLKTTPLKYDRKFYVQFIYIKKEKIKSFLTDLFGL